MFELLEQGVGIETTAERLGITRAAMIAFVETPERAERVARARARAADYLAQEALTIADELTGEVARDRLRVDTRKWLAGKWNPTTYGDMKQPQVQINVAELHLAAVRVHAAEEQPVVVDASTNER